MPKARHFVSKSYNFSAFDRYRTMISATNRDGTKYFGVVKKCHGQTSNLEPCPLLFVRHDFAQDLTEVFDSDGLQSTWSPSGPVGFYCLSDDMVVYMVREREGFYLVQHVIQLVPPSKGDEIYKCSHMAKIMGTQYGVGITICTRRKPMEGLYALCSGLTLLQDFSRIFICGTDGKDRQSLTQLHCIAANPLLIDRYPDEDMTCHIIEVAHILSDSMALAFAPPVFCENVIHFWLMNLEDGTLATSVFGSLCKDSGDRYTAGLLAFDNSEIMKTGRIDAYSARFHSAAPIHLVYAARDCSHFNCGERVMWTVKQGKYKLLTLAGSLYKCLFNSTRLQDEIRHYEYWEPLMYVIYVIDSKEQKFRRIPYEVKQVGTPYMHAFFGSTAQGALLVVNLPKSSQRSSPRAYLRATVLWGPSTSGQPANQKGSEKKIEKEDTIEH